MTANLQWDCLPEYLRKHILIKQGIILVVEGCVPEASCYQYQRCCCLFFFLPLISVQTQRSLFSSRNFKKSCLLYTRRGKPPQQQQPVFLGVRATVLIICSNLRGLLQNVSTIKALILQTCTDFLLMKKTNIDTVSQSYIKSMRSYKHLPFPEQKLIP